MAVSNAHCLSNRNVGNVATKVVQELGCESLKPEQLQIVAGELQLDVLCGVWKTLFCLPAFRLRQDISEWLLNTNTHT